MGEEAEFRRQLAALEARFLRPRRASLTELAATLGARERDGIDDGLPSGRALWQRAAARGVIPAALVDDPRRRFRARRVGHHPAPPSKQAALLLASDPEGLIRAEALGREVVARLELWGAPKLERVVWRITGHAEDCPRAGRPPLGALRGPIERLRAVLGGPRRIHEIVHPHRRFQHVADLLTWSRRLRQLGGSAVPARVETPLGRATLDPALVGRTLAELPDPLAPWLELCRSGYQLWSVWREGGIVELNLAAPFGPRRDLGRAHAGGVDAPRAVWSGRTSALRLAAARGDLGSLRQRLELQPRAPERGQPPLTSYAVYGGRGALEILAERDWLELEARDRAGKTPLMIAASLASSGPAGGRPEEIEVPISSHEGASACRYLIGAGAEREARDHDGRTALHWAVHGRHLACVDALLDCGAAVDARDHRGRTPLMLALDLAPALPVSLVEFLAPREPNIDPIVERLLAAKPDTDLRDAQGWTVLHYLARAGGSAPPSLIRRLIAGGARPSRDRLGASPADICARGFRGERHDRGPFDSRTAVAAGPGPWPRLDPPVTLVASLVEGVRAVQAGARPTRAQLDDWLVWADWLQGQGDPRGELVAASVASVGLGRRARREARARVAELEARCVVALDRGLDPVVHDREPARIRAGAVALPRLERDHGFVTRADVHGHGDWSPAEALAAARCLLDHEPLVTTLMLGPHEAPGPRWDGRWDGPADWSELLAGLATLEPHAGVRELVLRGLPLAVVEIAGLERALAGVRGLSLRGYHHLAGVHVRWPGLTTLRLSHGRRQRIDHDAAFEVELELPDLRALDLDLPPGSAELSGVVGALDQLPALRRLRVRRTSVALISWLAGSRLASQLVELELDAPTPEVLAALLEHAAGLAEVERLRLICAYDEAPGGASVAELRARLPRLERRELRARARPPAKW